MLGNEVTSASVTKLVVGKTKKRGGMGTEKVWNILSRMTCTRLASDRYCVLINSAKSMHGKSLSTWSRLMLLLCGTPSLNEVRRKVNINWNLDSRHP
jgi:hypothetical protein